MPGDLCRIGLHRDRPDDLRGPLEGERFWVTVVERKDDGGYIGSLCHALQLLPLRQGDTLLFGPCHVLDVADTPYGAP